MFGAHSALSSPISLRKASALGINFLYSGFARTLETAVSSKVAKTNFKLFILIPPRSNPNFYCQKLLVARSRRK